MLLRQALEQTRAGMPIPVLFNSRNVACHHLDEVSAMVQKDAFNVRFHTDRNRAAIRSFVRGFAGQVSQGQPHRRGATLATGARA